MMSGILFETEIFQKKLPELHTKIFDWFSENQRAICVYNNHDANIYFDNF